MIAIRGSDERAAGRRPCVLVAATVLMLFASLAPASVDAGVLRNVEYARVGDVPLNLDLYIPDGADRPLPLVIWIHGGAWVSGSKNATRAPAVLGSGYVVASVDYRLAQVAPFPAQIHDCKAAVRFLRARADEFGIDADRIGVWGSSAGGHLAALLATSGDVSELEGTVGDHLDVSSRVQAACDFYGPSDLVALVDETGIVGALAVGRLLGGPFVEREDLARLASPTTHVDFSDPPFLIVHGDADEIVPWDQSVRLHRVLAEAGVDASLWIVGRAGHGGFPSIVDDVVRAFFQRVLGGAADVLALDRGS